MSTFEAWPKTPRWNREVIITEKIDGTNSAIIIELDTLGYAARDDVNLLSVEEDGGSIYKVFAQSRNRLIFPGKMTDNYGFAAWVQENS